MCGELFILREMLIQIPNMLVPTVLCYLLVCICSGFTAAATTAKATAPVSPVEEGAILSIHCEVFNLEPTHQVIIYRTSPDGQPTTLSYGEGVSHDVDDRVFLAVRQQIDGSTVFFLSIMSVTRHEGGQYFCKVFNVAEHAPSTLPVSPVTVDVSYFPSDSDPVCSPKEPPVVTVGDIITMNCSSGKGSPTVLINWVRSDGVRSARGTFYDTEDGVIHSELEFRVKASDSKVVFSCEISSPAFPGRKQSCHIGPLVVIDAIDHDSSSNGDIEQPFPAITEPSSYPVQKGDGTNNVFTSIADCEEFCSYSESSLLYWVISTCVAGLVAFVFLIIGVFLFIKFNRLSELETQTTYISTRQPGDKIYDELESRRMEHSMYMSLEKARHVELHGVYPTCEP